MVSLKRWRATDGRPLRQLLGPLIRPQRGRMVKMSAAAIVGGFAEAAVLVLIARIAFALASTGDEVNVDLGPLGSQKIPVTTLIIAALALVVLRVALQAVSTVLATRIGARPRKHTVVMSTLFLMVGCTCCWSRLPVRS